MAKVRFTIDSGLPVDTVLAVATDFSENRPRYWPNIDPKAYKMHARSATSAEVTEGSAVFGGIWAREAYDWSEPNTVRATVQESNAFQPGGTWQLRATPRPEGGCHIEVLNHRVAKGFKGRVIGTMLALMGSKVLPKQLQQTLDIVAHETGQRALVAGGVR
ncbi:MAG: hypothetical protein NVS1B3_17980 [Candidatus Dormibacteraceae bacterium]